MEENNVNTIDYVDLLRDKLSNNDSYKVSVEDCWDIRKLHISKGSNENWFTFPFTEDFLTLKHYDLLIKRLVSEGIINDK